MLLSIQIEVGRLASSDPDPDSHINLEASEWDRKTILGKESSFLLDLSDFAQSSPNKNESTSKNTMLRSARMPLK